MKTKAVACMLAWLLTAVAEQDDPSKPCPKLTENGECPPGSVMNDDGKTCNDIDECLTDNGGCARASQATFWARMAIPATVRYVCLNNTASFLFILTAVAFHL
eukprot:1394324-Amorphochlora_amoeboformis.AAC.1